MKRAADQGWWPQSDIVERIHLMQSPFPLSDERCSSGMRHQGSGDKVVNSQLRIDLVEAYHHGVVFIITYSGAIVCRQNVGRVFILLISYTGVNPLQERRNVCKVRPELHCLFALMTLPGASNS